MGNSHPGWKLRLVNRAFRNRAFSVKVCQEQGDTAMRSSEAWKKLGAGVDQIAPETFAPPGLAYPTPIAPLGIEIPTQRSAITFSDAGRDRVRGSGFEIPFPFLSLIQPTANKPAIGRSSDVEQWKLIPRKAESGTQTFL